MTIHDSKRILKLLIKLTESKSLKWQSQLLDSGKIKFFARLEKFEIIIIENKTVPDVYISSKTNIARLNLQSGRYMKMSIQPAEELAISLLVSVKTNCFSDLEIEFLEFF